MRRFLCATAALACLPLSGCIGGAVYRHTIMPLDVNLTDTPIGTTDGYTDIKDINIQYVRIMWDGNDVAGAAKKAGIQTVHYADLEVFSILGIWTQTWIHVHGQ